MVDAVETYILCGRVLRWVYVYLYYLEDRKQKLLADGADRGPAKVSVVVHAVSMKMRD
jgi:hypothetical protein